MISVDPTQLKYTDKDKLYVFKYKDRDRLGRLVTVTESDPGDVLMLTPDGYRCFHKRGMSNVYQITKLYHRFRLWLKGVRI